MKKNMTNNLGSEYIKAIANVVSANTLKNFTNSGNYDIEIFYEDAKDTEKSHDYDLFSDNFKLPYNL